MNQEVRPVVYVEHDGIPRPDQLLDHAGEDEPDITSAQLDAGIRGGRSNRRGNSLIGPIDQALLDLDDIDRVDVEGRSAATV